MRSPRLPVADPPPFKLQSASNCRWGGYGLEQLSEGKVKGKPWQTFWYPWNNNTIHPRYPTYPVLSCNMLKDIHSTNYPTARCPWLSCGPFWLFVDQRIASRLERVGRWVEGCWWVFAFDSWPIVRRFSTLFKFSAVFFDGYLPASFVWRGASIDKVQSRYPEAF